MSNITINSFSYHKYVSASYDMPLISKRNIGTLCILDIFENYLIVFFFIICKTVNNSAFANVGLFLGYPSYTGGEHKCFFIFIFIECNM